VRLFPKLRDRVQSGVFFSSIDWAGTRAFADGIREGIYINLRGREPEGIVDPAEYEGLRSELAEKLAAISVPAHAAASSSMASRTHRPVSGSRRHAAETHRSGGPYPTMR